MFSEHLIGTFAAPENPFKGNLTGLPKLGGGEFGKFYSLPSLNDPRIGNSLEPFYYVIEVSCSSCCQSYD